VIRFAHQIPVALLAGLLFAAPARTAESGINLIRSESALGFGWSGATEYADGREFRWITRLEADAWFELEAATDTEIVFMAAPLYINWRRQVIGVYINNRFLTEWVCPDRPDFEEYRVDVPSGVLRPGRNRLTFRMAYRKRIPPDRRELALAVHRIVVQPK
jgi:hypothetical protein